MGGHKTISGSGDPTPAPAPPPVADYHVTGVITPDATGDYFAAGIQDGQTYYKRADNAFYIYYHAADAAWWIATTLGGSPSTGWTNISTNILDQYRYNTNTNGTAIVLPGPA